MIGVLGRRPLTTTESNWLLGLGLAVAGVVFFAAVGALEDAVGSAPRRAQLVRSPSETLTRFLAIAHTIVATLFLLTSRRVRSRAGATWIAVLAALGVVLCLGFSALGGFSATLAVVLFFGYFLLHELRDELFFYRINGDAPRSGGDGPAARPLWPLAGLLLAAVVITFGIGILAGARARRISLTGALPAAHVAIAVVLLAVGIAAAVKLVRRATTAEAGGWRGILANHRPLLVVLGGLYLVVMGGLVFTGRAYMVVAVHVTVWFVFALQRMPSVYPKPRVLTWRWARETRAGFTVLHGGVLLAVVAGAALWAFGFQNANEPAVFGVLFSRESFPYWTIMHVTLSWIPRASPPA